MHSQAPAYTYCRAAHVTIKQHTHLLQGHVALHQRMVLGLARLVTLALQPRHLAAAAAAAVNGGGSISSSGQREHMVCGPAAAGPQLGYVMLLPAHNSDT